MSRQKDFAKNTAILTFGRICTQSISFLLLPLYTALLSTAEYGLFDLLVTYATLILPLVNWQFDQGLFRFMLEVRGKTIKQKELFSTITIVNIVQATVFTLIFILIKPLLSIENPYFLMLYVDLQIFTALLLQFSRGIGRITVYAIASFLSAATTIVLNVFALVVFKLGLLGLFITTNTAQIVVILYLIFATRCWNYFSFKLANKNIFREVRKYALPLIPNNLAWWVVNSSDRMVISHFLGVAANGIFTVASKFSSVFINFYNVVNLSWTETVTINFEDKDRDEFLSDTMTTLFKLFASACFLVIALMPFVYPILVNERFADGYNQVIILMYAMLFRVLIGLYSCVYIATKQSKKIATTSMMSAVINLVFDLLFINTIGLYAASISSLIAFLSMFIFRYIDLNKSVKLKIRRNVAIPSIVVGTLLIFPYYSQQIIVQFFALIITFIYVVVINRDILTLVLKQVRGMKDHLSASRKDTK